jgi:hypothetical protein
MNAFSPIGIYASVLLMMATLVIFFGLRLRDQAYPPMYGIILALIPSFICIGLFWSLAIHMYHKLGDWPLGIGYEELDGSLLFHAEASFSYYWQLIVLSILVLPVPFVISASIRRLRRFLIYIGLHAAGVSIATLMMFLAPLGFQHWWWD